MTFEDYVQALASRTRQEGGTASKPAARKFLPPRDLWCFPKYPAQTSILPPDVDLHATLTAFLAAHEGALAEEDCWLGTWVHPQTGEIYLDVSTGIADLEAARTAARQYGTREGRPVVAMFNPLRNETVFLE